MNWALKPLMFWMNYIWMPVSRATPRTLFPRRPSTTRRRAVVMQRQVGVVSVTVQMAVTRSAGSRYWCRTWACSGRSSAEVRLSTCKTSLLNNRLLSSERRVGPVAGFCGPNASDPLGNTSSFGLLPLREEGVGRSSRAAAGEHRRGFLEALRAARGGAGCLGCPRGLRSAPERRDAATCPPQPAWDDLQEQAAAYSAVRCTSARTSSGEKARWTSPLWARCRLSTIVFVDYATWAEHKRPIDGRGRCGVPAASCCAIAGAKGACHRAPSSRRSSTACITSSPIRPAGGRSRANSSNSPPGPFVG
jgi:hypothetical protein